MNILELKKELENLNKKLTGAGESLSGQEMQEMSKRYAHLRYLIDTQEQIDTIEKRIQENKKITEEENDPEFVRLAEEELQQDIKQKRKLEDELQNPQSSDSVTRSADAIILEIRAGVGGEEASLFAQNLLRMYNRYAEQQGWKFIILDQSQTELGGVKEAICEVRGTGAFSKLQYESGVHRIQRIPETEKNGRVHTSTVSVAVLPKAKSIDIQINPQDLRIDVFRASGPGGQYVNKTSSAVRITHIPSGVMVSSQAGRSQGENKEVAMTILRSRLLKQKQEEEADKRRKARRKQIGSAERSEKIRTYNIPQDRITDHRIGKSWHNTQHILDGGLDTILDALEKSTHNGKD